MRFCQVKKKIPSRSRLSNRSFSARAAARSSARQRGNSGVTGHARISALTRLAVMTPAAEQPTVERLHQHIEELGFRRAGKHHEIYLSDFRKASPEKLKTIIRQPMER